MDRLGFGYDAVKRAPPVDDLRLDFRLRRYRPAEATVPAMTLSCRARPGIMDITGPRDGAPHKVGAAIGDLVSGLYAAQGILAALYAASADGTRPARQHLHVRGGGLAAHLQCQHLLRHRQLAAPARQRASRPSCPTRPSRPPTAGSISASPTTICGGASAPAAERTDLIDDPRFAKASDRVRNREDAGAAGQDHHQGAHARRVAGAHGQGRRAERRHPHRGRGVRQRAPEGARHGCRDAALQCRHRQSRQECRCT